MWFQEDLYCMWIYRSKKWNRWPGFDHSEPFFPSPFDEGTLFLFCGRKTNRMKGLLWEVDGFVLLYKRLEEGRFQWPRKTEDIENISIEQYHWLLEGMAITQRKTIQKVERKMIL